MAVLIFFIVLSALVLVHEFGHFLAAKICNVAVNEFGFGFPPKIVKLFRWKETEFTLNALPFGGFVKLEGENEVEIGSIKSFATKHPAKKLFILFAGIIGNLLFAWLLMSIVLSVGVSLSASTANEYGITGDTQTLVVDVTKDSPAAIAGLLPGENIANVSPTDIQALVAQSNGNPITLDTVSENGQIASHTITPQYDAQTSMYHIGIATDQVLFAKLPVMKAIPVGLVMTANLTKQVTVGMIQLIGGLFKGHADTSSVTGPIGLVGIVGQASKIGFISLLTLTALISVNLAVINLVPFPALDGGRIFVTIIEWIRGKQFNSNILGKVHSIGFIILIGILIAVTVKDIKGLF